MTLRRISALKFRDRNCWDTLTVLQQRLSRDLDIPYFTGSEPGQPQTHTGRSLLSKPLFEWRGKHDVGKVQRFQVR